MSNRNLEIGKWADGSAFVENGTPKLWFHGTDLHDPFNIFAYCGEGSLGFHFGDQKAANNRIDEIFRMMHTEENEGIIIPVICRATNPLVLSDLYTWGQHDVASALADAGVIDDEEIDFVADLATEAALFAAIELASYDCIVYRNLCENKDEPTQSLLIWRAELLKSPYAASFEKDDPRLLPQNHTLDSDYQSWKQLASDIENEKVEIECNRENAKVPAFG